MSHDVTKIPNKALVALLLLICALMSGRNIEAQETSGFRTGSSAAIAREEYGVGVALRKHPGGFLVTKVVSNSPAAMNNLVNAGDLIVAVAQSNAPPVSLERVEHIEEAVSMIRGDKGTLVRLTIVPGATNTSQTKAVTLIRGELPGVSFGGLWKALPAGAVAPNAILTFLPESREAALRDNRDKIVVLEFWATWCGPCLKLMPQIQREAARLSKEILLITVSIDEHPAAALKRLEAEGWTNTRNAWGGQSIAGAFGVSSIPAMCIINRAGKVIYNGFPLGDEAIMQLITPK